MQLETERLILRMPEKSDLDAWTEMYAQSEVQRFLSARPHERVAVRKDDGRVIGRAEMLVWDDRTWTPTTLRDAGAHGEVEIGWALHPDVWGRGYATEASTVCRDYVLERIRPRVIALIDPENERSIRVAERLGLAHERDVRQNGSKTMRLYALEQDRA